MRFRIIAVTGGMDICFKIVTNPFYVRKTPLKKWCTMKKIKLSALIMTLACSLLFIYSGCGGGGNDEDEISLSLSFTGVESAALITPENAQEIAASAFWGGAVGITLEALSAFQVGWDDNSMDAPILNVLQVIDDAIQRVDLSSEGNAIAAVTTKEGRIGGGCGGNAFYTIGVDEETGTFSGTIAFNDFCDGEIILNAGSGFSGLFDNITNEFLELNFSFNNLIVTAGGQPFVFDGDSSFDKKSIPEIIEMEILIQNPSGRVFWVNSYILSIIEIEASLDIDITGRFYHPDFGFVDITDETTFRIFDTDDWPSSGTLFLKGADNTSARLIALDAMTAEVTADTAGDGFDDFETGAVNWENL